MSGRVPPGGKAGTRPLGPVRRWSVRTRLTVLTSALLCVALAAGAVALAAVLARERIGAVDTILRERLAVVTGLVEEDRVPRALPVAQPGEVAQVLDADGRVVASSPTGSRTLPLLAPDELPEPRDPVDPDDDDASGAAPPVLRTLATGYDTQARVAVGTAVHRGAPVHVVVSLPLTEVQGVLRALAVALVAVVPLLTALLAWAIRSVLGRALRPVEEMRAAAAEVARSGRPGAIPVPDADDELAALARTLNEMLDRLEHAAARQRRFVADAAHELRSPLAALRAQVDVARAHPGAFAAGELAADLEPEVLRVQRLVDDLLLLARVGARPVVAVTVDLRVVVDEAVRQVGTAGSSGGDVRVSVSGAGAAWADAAGLTRVVRNLVENAVRHARSAVTVEVAPGRVVVDDDGAGVAPEDRERVLERFVRLDDARDRDRGGAGLGLPIAREVARENGGDVVLEDSPTGGLRVTVTVPVGGPGEQVIGEPDDMPAEEPR